MLQSFICTVQNSRITQWLLGTGVVLAIVAATSAGATLAYAEAPPPNPGIVLGSAISLEPVASKGGRLYSIIGGGIYFTMDGGAEWKRMAAAATPRLFPSSLAVDPANPLVVYMGTNYNSLYKSVDGGITYFRSSTGLGAGTQVAVTAIHIPPVQPGILMAATAYWVGTSERNLVPQGLYLSTNAGRSWLQVDDALGETAITSLTLDTANVVTAQSADGSIQTIPLDKALSDLTQNGTTQEREQVPAAIKLLGIQTGQAELDRRFWAGEDLNATAARLAFLGTPAAMRTLVSGLGETRETARRHIAMQTLEFMGEKAVPALITGLSDDNATVRRYSAELLGWIASESGKPALERALLDGSQAVRDAAAWALTQLP